MNSEMMNFIVRVLTMKSDQADRIVRKSYFIALVPQLPTSFFLKYGLQKKAGKTARYESHFGAHSKSTVMAEYSNAEVLCGMQNYSNAEAET